EFAGEAGDAFGYDVNQAGDVNGDGHGDVIVGAALADFKGFQSGRVYVFSGADGTVLWMDDGDSRNAFLGSGVGNVGDLNGDGRPELVAGAYGVSTRGNPAKGRAYVYDGATGTVLLTLSPPTNSPLSRFGEFFTSAAGDVNADGTPDIFVADYNSSIDNKYAGKAYVFSGSDGALLLTISGNTVDGLGPGRGIGDITGDGHADVIVAAYTNSEGAPAGGKTYLISGADGTVIRTMTGNIAFDFQGVDALGLGDVNGDGAQDYLITGFSSAYVVLGIP
ncbi:MAG TPA: integrin alpha, partial [Anaerolineales bacterium]|nr:integrin alpha [Anaerolineales bacterium]